MESTATAEETSPPATPASPPADAGPVTPVPESVDNRRFSSTVGATLFASRWLQAPLYFGLVVAQLFYVFTFMKELWHIASHITSMKESDMMLMVLGLVDVVMVANLLIMVIVGGYETFVSRVDLKDHPDQPEWLSHVNANVLKVKLAMAIIGISSVHLLKTFVEAKGYYLSMGSTATALLLSQTAIHLAFILSAMGLAWIDNSSRKSMGH
ncbi:TIGR00645 family protein [Austwickia sp. TVS 96-490-7B]|uniref:TIGR00645 family protein n=1 Tax=Austwickia sp. TVS 96-490-7B TaxID=2830843 RepID=UPI0021040129|nr:TIGR00645 family protein [Austwickia sp. TVS 96-490-7B]